MTKTVFGLINGSSISVSDRPEAGLGAKEIFVVSWDYGPKGSIVLTAEQLKDFRKALEMVAS